MSEKSHQSCLIAHIHDGALHIDCSGLGSSVRERYDGKREGDFTNANMHSDNVKVEPPRLS